MNIKKLFLTHCKDKELEINTQQVNIVDLINIFYQDNFNNSFLSNLFSKKKK